MSEDVHRAGHLPIAGTGRLQTAEESATYANALKAREQTIPTLNEFLQRLFTLDVALIGGGFVVAKGDVLPYWCGVAVLTILVASLFATLTGRRR